MQTVIMNMEAARAMTAAGAHGCEQDNLNHYTKLNHCTKLKRWHVLVRMRAYRAVPVRT
jgi:hypothetical protein